MREREGLARKGCVGEGAGRLPSPGLLRSPPPPGVRERGYVLASGLFARLGDVARGKPGMADAPAALAPKAQAVEVEIDHRGRVEGQELADDQPANDRDAERPAQFRTLAEPDR